MTETVTRFAPSPTGHLHLGHVHSALQGWTTAREAGGRFLLRIEDIDGTRCRPEFTEAILEDLTWLGIDWHGAVRRQSEHFDDYRSALARLEDQKLLYPCFCTRAEIQAEIARSADAPHGPEGPRYPGTCRSLSETERERRMAVGDAFALRIDMAKALGRTGPLFWEDDLAGRIEARPLDHGDVVLARKETPTSYHLAVAVDDALQGVTLVTRGEDLFLATDVHRQLQALLELPVPRYCHHGLLRDAEGRRFAKRDKSLTIASLRKAGKSPAEVRKLAGF